MFVKLSSLSKFLCVLLIVCSSIALAETWRAGLTLSSVTDPMFNRDVEVAFWFPTEAEIAEISLGPFVLNVAQDAEPVDDIKGIILISHGFAGDFLSHSDTAIYLAEQGFFVVAPTHPDEAGLAKEQVALDPLVLRPRHLSLMLDGVLGHPQYGPLLAAKPIGVVAHSLGTYAALVQLGATPSLEGFDTYCLGHPQDTLLCSPRAEQRLQTVLEEGTFEADKRIAAAVLLAPAYAPLFDAAALSHIAIPLKLVVAEQDEELSEFHAEHFAESFDQTPLMIENAGHYVFISPCPESLEQDLAFLCLDPNGVDRIAVHEHLNREISSFFEEAIE